MENIILSPKKQTAFRLSEDLLERLKVEARKANRSLNNYVESVLMDVVYKKANRTTLEAIKDAKENKDLETLDMHNFEGYVASL